LLDPKALVEQLNLSWFFAPHRQVERPWPTWDIALMRLGSLVTTGYSRRKRVF
jgi:hypothetical protein